MPPRKRQARTRKAKRKAIQKRTSMMPIQDPQDLAEHVAGLYVGKILDSENVGSVVGAGKSSSSLPPPHSQQVPSNLDKYPCLLLNADYQPMSYLPLSLWNWQEAIKAVFSGKVTVVDVYSDVTIRAASIEVPLPSVIALSQYVPPPKHHTPAFTRRNVFLRDEYRCQYCRQSFPKDALSIDHVHPRAKGGTLHWTNAVTSCLRCNGIKGSRSLDDIRMQFGMQLVREPYVPTNMELARIASRMVPRRKVHATWEPFLGATARKES